MIIILYFTCIYVSCFRTSCSYTPHGISSYTRQDYICVCHAEKRKAYNTNIKISMWIVQNHKALCFFTHLNCVLWASKTNVYDVVFFLLKAKKNISILPYNRFPCEWPISNPTFSCKTCFNAPEIEHFYSDKIRGN